MSYIVFSMPDNESLADKITAGIMGKKGEYLLRKFPDGESYVRILTPVEKEEVIIVCSLNKPDEKFLSLLFFCRLAKDLKAQSVCIIVPYLSYMRQDKVFNPGEAVTSTYFASLLSGVCDQIITLDPHLHRRKSMQEIYTIPCKVLHATKLISDYVKDHIEKALLIGPDSESEQWVSEVAEGANVPFIILEKTRYGDKKVKISELHVEKYKDCTPVLIDDMISTARTMIESVDHLKEAGMKPAVCIGIHAVFAEDSFSELQNSGVRNIITSNSIQHSSNEIEISKMFIEIFKNE